MNLAKYISDGVILGFCVWFFIYDYRKRRRYPTVTKNGQRVILDQGHHVVDIGLPIQRILDDLGDFKVKLEADYTVYVWSYDTVYIWREASGWSRDGISPPAQTLEEAKRRYDSLPTRFRRTL